MEAVKGFDSIEGANNGLFKLVVYRYWWTLRAGYTKESQVLSKKKKKGSQVKLGNRVKLGK